MLYTSNDLEREAAHQTAALMCAAARTAPKACGVDCIHTLVVEGTEKDALSKAMREYGKENGVDFCIRDAGNVDDALSVVLIGADVAPRELDCGYCGVKTCDKAREGGITCAIAVDDLGIAVGSAATVAMDHRIDNRVLFSAGRAALNLKLFPDNVTIAFGIGLAITGKNVFFDRAS